MYVAGPAGLNGAMKPTRTEPPVVTTDEPSACTTCVLGPETLTTIDFPVSTFVWDYVPDRVVDPRIVGDGHIDGVDTTVLSFYGPLGSAAYWFRLWVDPTGLVRRAEMRAQGHFMNQRYFDFDAPITIEPPHM